MKPQYDVCLSFAGEDRDYVKIVAAALKLKGVAVFFDEYEVVGLWGKDLYQHLDEVYRNRARFCVVFVSEHYARKLWTRHELRSAQARAFSERLEYILPARFDETELPGMPPTLGYIDLRSTSADLLADLIMRKLAGEDSATAGNSIPSMTPPSPKQGLRHATLRRASLSRKKKTEG